MSEKKSLEERQQELIQQGQNEIAKVPPTSISEFRGGFSFNAVAKRREIVDEIIEKYRKKMDELDKDI